MLRLPSPTHARTSLPPYIFLRELSARLIGNEPRFQPGTSADLLQLKVSGG